MEETLEDSIICYSPVVGITDSSLLEKKEECEVAVVQIPSIEGTPLAETLQQQVWFTPLMFLFFAFYTMSVMRYASVFLRDLKTFFNPTPGRLHSATVPEVSHVRRLPLYLSVFPLALFAYWVRDLWGITSNLSIGMLLLYLVAVVSAYILFKIGTIRLLTYIFFDDDVYVKLKLSYDTVLIVLSAVLFVVDIFITYSSYAEISIYVGFLVCVFAVLLYLLKLFIVFFHGLPSLFYLILYLCTLEILPSAAFCLGLVGIV